MTNEEIFKEWASSIPKEIGDLLDDFSLNHTYPVGGILKKSLTKSLDVARKDEAMKFAEWIFKDNPVNVEQLYQIFKNETNG